MKWMLLLLTSFALGQELPTQLAGTNAVACPEPAPGTICFGLGGTVSEAEARIDANADALGLDTAGWHDSMSELFEGWDVTGPEPVGYRYTAIETSEAWLVVIVSAEAGIMIVNLAAQP